MRKGFLLCFGFFPCLLFGQSKNLEVLEKAIQIAARRAAPSVVHLRIEATPTSLGWNPVHRMMFGRGSGDLRTVARRTVSATVVSRDGYLVTDASHLIGKVKQITIVLPSGREIPAKLVGKDLRYNLALLKAQGKAKWKPPVWAQKDSLEVGQFVASLGRGFNPKRPSVSFGIISALKRYAGHAIQTDAAVSPGYTGGLLIDLEGKALGVLVVLSRRVGVNSGIGFAICGKTVLQAVEFLKKAKKDVFPAFLGIRFSKAKQGGVEILEVVPGTAAEKYGLKKGDRIVEAEGKKIRSEFDLRDIILGKIAGQKLTLKFYRRGKLMEKTVVLGRRPTQPRRR